jgi:hypothetical protein
MVLKDILSISGESGLYKFIAQGKNAIIVEHLESKKRTSVYASAKVSSLEEIAIYTDKEDISLGKVFDLIHEKENGGAAVDPKGDITRLREWFAEVIPDYSRERVYTSDIKKVAQWYNILHRLDLLVKEEPDSGKGDEEEEKEKEKEKKEEGETKKDDSAKG